MPTMDANISVIVALTPATGNSPHPLSPGRIQPLGTYINENQPPFLQFYQISLELQVACTPMPWRFAEMQTNGIIVAVHYDDFLADWSPHILEAIVKHALG